jgi:FkbM family methyltransferase
MDINKTIQIAFGYAQAGQVEQAINLLKKILELQPKDINAINILGTIHYHLKNYDSAIKYMQTLINLNPSNAQAYYIVGHSMQQKNQLEQAITYYQRSVQIDPNFADAYYNLGTIFQDKGRHDEAIASYKCVLKINPKDSDAYYNLGAIYQGKGLLDKAITYYQKALQINPTLDDACQIIGAIYQGKGLLDKAITYYQKALQINPTLDHLASSLKHLSQMKAIKQLLQKENPLILEIGSHVGGDTKLFLQTFKDVVIYCFEPDPRCIAQFKNNIKDSRCVLIEMALSNIDGKTLLNLSGGCNPEMPRKGEWDASSSIKKAVSHSQAYPWLTFESSIEVRTIKLDTWVTQNNIQYIDFIWSDIQGAERDLIEGAINALKITKYLFMEYGEISPYPEAMTRDQTISVMKRHNFEIIQELSDTSERGNVLFKNNKL